MQTSTLLSTSLLAVGFAAWASPARADSTAANCEVRKEGDKQKGKSGPCTVSQRQGFVEIDLKNGDTISLSPGNSAGHLKDQHGNKVSRTSTGKAMSLHWENGRHVIVTWEGNRYGGSTYNNNNNYDNNTSNRNYNNYNGSGGNHSAEYQRGYNDGLRGNWDQSSHSQDYKDGYRAAEKGGGGNGGNGGQHSRHGNYSINQLGNGQFEVVWSRPFCSVLIGRDGGIKQTTEDCTSQQIDRAREVGRRGK